MKENARKHDRIPLQVKLILQIGDRKPERFPATVLNASKGGLAIFSQRALPPGSLVSMELIVPTVGEGLHHITLFGVTRWMRVEMEGNVAGIQLIQNSKAGDYDWYAEHFDSHVRAVHARTAQARAGADRHGFTLVEVSIAMVIICLMMTLAVPLFTQAIEHSRMDSAVANLKTLWAAQRTYWLEERQFSPNLSYLSAMDLVDAAIAASATDPNAVYSYEVVSADSASFTCRAVRNGSSVWSGEICIDEEGAVTGSITSSDGTVLTPIY